MFGLLGLLRFKWTYLFLGVVVLGIGLIDYLGAHPSQPVEIDGAEAYYVEVTNNNSYTRNELKLANDSNTYELDKNTFHPTLPDSVYKGGKIQIWVDHGSTTIIAITLYDGNDENPTKYTTTHYDNPQSELSDSQGSAIVAAVVGIALIAVFGIWFVVGRRGRTLQPAGAAIGGAAMPFTGGGIGLSPDGKWYWDGSQWRNVSPDGRYRWDGAQWRELGGVGPAVGAPPPPRS
ncbi:MAG TPA: hypothetical protein VIP57_17115 [Candidatus Dormibacteraeota bacterium]